MPRWAILIAAIGGIGLAGPADAVEYTITDLGALGTSSAAFAVNDSGQVVGISQLPGNYIRAFRWRPSGGMTELGVGLTKPGWQSVATGIDLRGRIAGYRSQASASNVYEGFVWTSDVGGTALGTLSGGTQSYAQAINTTGQIVGASTVASGKYHAVLWTLAYTP